MKLEGWIRFADEGNLKGEWIASSSCQEIDQYAEDYPHRVKITVNIPDVQAEGEAREAADGH